MRWSVLIVAFFLSGCENLATWDEIRNKPDQQVHDKQVCTAGGMDYAVNAYSEVKCKHPAEPPEGGGQ